MTVFEFAEKYIPKDSNVFRWRKGRTTEFDYIDAYIFDLSVCIDPIDLHRKGLFTYQKPVTGYGLGYIFHFDWCTSGFRQFMIWLFLTFGAESISYYPHPAEEDGYAGLFCSPFFGYSFLPMKVTARHYCPNSYKHLSTTYEYEVNDLVGLDELRKKFFTDNKELCKFCKAKTNYWMQYNTK